MDVQMGSMPNLPGENALLDSTLSHFKALDWRYLNEFLVSWVKIREMG